MSFSTKLFISIFIACVSFSAFLSARHTIEPVVSKLKVKQPNWQMKTVGTDADGNRQVIYYEHSLESDKDIPVKEIYFRQDGTRLLETDLLVLDSDEPAVKKCSTRVAYHGPSVSYAPEGNIDKIEFYNKNELQGPIKTYFSNGLLESLKYIQDGKFEGNSDTYYSDGSPKTKSNYLYGKLDGSYESYFPDGSLASKTYYKNGLPDGEALEWYENGNLKSKIEMQKGLLQGSYNQIAYTKYYPGQKVEESMDYRNGRPHGLHTMYHPNRKEGYRVNYKNGLKEGWEHFYDENETSIGKGEFKKGKPIGDHIRQTAEGTLIYLAKYDGESNVQQPILEFDSNGTKRLQYTLVNKQYHGDFSEWHPNEQLKRAYHYQMGLFEGPQKEFHENGQLKLQVTYRDHEKQGMYAEWDDTGKVAQEVNYENGKKNGLSVSWFLSSSKKSEVTFVDNKRNGNETHWFDNGQIASMAGYALDKLEGWKREWTKEGTLLFEAQYHENLPQGTIQEWYADGRQKRVAHYKNNQLHGKEETFHSNGQPASVANYKDGLRDGEILFWQEDGSLLSDYYFDFGKPVGTHREYFEKDLDYPEHRLSRIMTYENGMPHGEQKSYYRTGAKKSYLQFVEGLLVGVKSLWNPEGDLLEESHYDHGKLEGRYFLVKPDGKELIFHYKDNLPEGLHLVYYPPHQFFGKVKALEAHFEKGKLEGEVAEYNEAGTKIASTPYRQGNKEGVASVFGDDGKLRISAEFKNDDQNGMAYEYFPSGKLFRQVLYANNFKEGEEKTYYENGQLAAFSNYKNGDLHGPSKEWSSKGILMFEGEYTHGAKNGKFNKYDEKGAPRVFQTYANDELVDKKRFPTKALREDDV